MRIAACFFPSRGHLNMLVPAIETLASRGHKIDLYGCPALTDITHLPDSVSRTKAGLPSILETIYVPGCYSGLRAWVVKNRPDLLRAPETQFGVSSPARRASTADGFTRRFHSLNFDSLCRVLTLIEFYDDLRREFEHGKPDVILHDSNERASLIVGDELGIPVVTVPARADFMTPGYRELEDDTLSFFNLDHTRYTAGRNAVIAIGPRQLYAGDAGSSEYFSEYTPSIQRSDGISHRRTADAVFSFGTFAPEPSVDELLRLIDSLVSSGRTSIVMKLRDGRLREELQQVSTLPGSVQLRSDVDILEYVAPGVLYIGHGSLIGTMEALNAGADVHLLPSRIADHAWVSARCLELGWSWSSAGSDWDAGGAQQPAAGFVSANSKERSFPDLFAELFE